MDRLAWQCFVQQFIVYLDTGLSGHMKVQHRQRSRDSKALGELQQQKRR